MASLINNAVFTAASGGTGAFGVSAALTGYQTPAAAGATDTKTYRYRAESGDKSQWEIGTTVASSTATSFTRVVTASSAGGTTTVNFTNPPTVAIVPQAADILQFDDTMSLTTTQQRKGRLNIGADFEATTVMLFWQAAAPTGWTKLVTQNDKALRVVSGTGGGTGGTNSFSTVMAQSVVGGTSISTAQLAAHTHDAASGAYFVHYYGSAHIGAWTAGTQLDILSVTQSTGSGSSHNHSITMAIQYLDLILASKD